MVVFMKALPYYIAVIIPAIGLAFINCRILALGLAWPFAILTSMFTIGLFCSVLFKGIGSRRSGAMVLSLAFFNILATIWYFAVLYSWHGIMLNSSLTASLSDALYFSVVTWTTLGYGDILPVFFSRWVVIFQVMLGYITMALLISTMVVAIPEFKGKTR